MVGRKERIKDEGISEREYKILFLIAGLFSVAIVILSLQRNLSSWGIRALITGVLVTILVYYSTLNSLMKGLLILASWVILLALVVSNFSYPIKLSISLIVLAIAVYAWIKRPHPQEKNVSSRTEKR
jgi:predicted membrane protein